jgi:hypothetical protein
VPVGPDPGHCAAKVPQEVVTTAEKARDPPARTEVVAGVTSSAMILSGPTATAPSTTRVESAALVATTW